MGSPVSPDTSPAGRRAVGFTVLEVLVAMLVFTIVLVGMAAMQVTVIRTSTSSRATSVAGAIAQSRIEQFRAQRYNTLAAVVDPAACFTYLGAPTICGTTPAFFVRTATVDAAGGGVCAGPTSGFCIQVQVTFGEAGGGRQVVMRMERTP